MLTIIDGKKATSLKRTDIVAFASNVTQDLVSFYGFKEIQGSKASIHTPSDQTVFV